MTTSKHTPVPFTRAATLDTTRAYMGSLMSFLTTGAETEGEFALMEFRGKPGNEPPPHIHREENEIVYVLDGVMEMYCGDTVMLLQPGEMAFVPRGQPHAFYIRSAQFRALVIVQAVGEDSVQLDEYFRRMSTVAVSMTLPLNTAGTYQAEDPERAVALANEHGMTILSPDEAAIALPQYPGFGKAEPLRDDTAPRNQSLAVFGAGPGQWPLAATGSAS